MDGPFSFQNPSIVQPEVQYFYNYFSIEVYKVQGHKAVKYGSWVRPNMELMISKLIF